MKDVNYEKLLSIRDKYYNQYLKLLLEGTKSVPIVVSEDFIKNLRSISEKVEILKEVLCDLDIILDTGETI